jgi:hypothetical protein
MVSEVGDSVSFILKSNDGKKALPLAKILQLKERQKTIKTFLRLLFLVGTITYEFEKRFKFIKQ